MVVSRHTHSSRIGADVLRRGGTAIDAAVATHFAINVVNPMSVGVGGGGSLVYYSASDETVYSIDFFPRAPGSVTPELFVDDDGEPVDEEVRLDSGAAVAVPGAVKGLVAAHNRFGRLPWRRLLTPAIDLARNGVVVDIHLAEAIADNWDRFNPAARAVFSKNGMPLSPGELLVQPELAETFERISEHQAAGFHEGEVAEAIATTVQDHGGALKPADLSGYPVRHNEPLCSEYGDFELYNPRLAITGGFLVPRILKTIERFDLSDQYGPESWQKYHLFAEATALAWADRAEYLGDPEFVDPPLAALLDPEFIESRAQAISLDDTLADYKNGDCVSPGSLDATHRRSTTDVSDRPGDEATTHFVAGDAAGNVVAVTSSINKGMGSGIMVPEYGVMLNNYMSLFDAEPGGPNQVAGGKRPLSSTSPTIVMTDSEPYFTAGSPGGVTIPQTTAQVILNVVEYDMSIDAAVAAPRITTDHCGPIEWEAAVPATVREQLGGLGHRWDTDPDEIGSANNLLIKDDRYYGGPDPRRDCVAVGVNEWDRL
ncbi:MAG: gamma-glutamyltransferase [Halobacteriales archaeon]|nr:gamma-glutamyltransferase [Halobacteriales archaeon]